MEPVLGVHRRFPGVYPVTIRGVVVGLEPLPGGQLHIGHHEVQLHPALVGVLDPQDVVLVGLEPRQERSLEVVHDLPLHLGG